MTLDEYLPPLHGPVFNWAVFNALFADQTNTNAERVLTHTWPFPTWIAVFVFFVLTAGIIILYRLELPNQRGRRVGLTVLRTMEILIVVFMLFGWLWRSFRTELPAIVVAIDRSASMATVDHYQEPELRNATQILSGRSEPTTRFDVARSYLLRNDAYVVRQLERRYQLKTFLWDTDSIEVSRTSVERSHDERLDDLSRSLSQTEATGPESRLGICLKSAIDAQRGQSTAAIVIFTDGVTTNGPTIGETAEVSRMKRIPLFIVGIGEERTPKDIAIADVLADEMAFVGDLIPFDVKLRQDGFEGKSVKVRLRDMGTEAVIDEQSVTFPESGETPTVRLTHRPERAGELDVRIEIDTPADDQIKANDVASRHVTVRDESIRVLLVQAYPNPEYHFLKRLLGRSLQRSTLTDVTPVDGKSSNSPSPARRAIELHTLLQDADSEFASQDETALRLFPTTREELFLFDVVILGDANPSTLGPAAIANLRDFVVEHGGGLVVIAGPQFTPRAYAGSPLAELFPIRAERLRLPSANAGLTNGFRVRPSVLGLATSHLQLANGAGDNVESWGQLPELYWAMESDQLKTGVRSLLEASDRVTSNGEPLPIVTLQFVGAGKVIFHATDESYRWSRSVNGELAFNRYWMQTLRYLTKSKLTGSRAGELLVDRADYRVGETIRFRMRFRDDRLAPQQDDGAALLLERPGAPPRQLVLQRTATEKGTFEASVSDLTAGEYRAWLSTPTLEGQPPSVRFTVSEPNGESQNVRLNGVDLRAAAQLTGGRYYRLPESLGLLRDLPAGSRVRLQPLPPEPIWNSLGIAGLFFGIVVAEWLLRRRWGLA